MTMFDSAILDLKQQYIDYSQKNGLRGWLNRFLIKQFFPLRLQESLTLISNPLSDDARLVFSRIYTQEVGFFTRLFFSFIHKFSQNQQRHLAAIVIFQKDNLLDSDSLRDKIAADGVVLDSIFQFNELMKRLDKDFINGVPFQARKDIKNPLVSTLIYSLVERFRLDFISVDCGDSGFVCHLTAFLDEVKFFPTDESDIRPLMPMDKLIELIQALSSRSRGISFGDGSVLEATKSHSNPDWANGYFFSTQSPSRFLDRVSFLRGVEEQGIQVNGPAVLELLTNVKDDNGCWHDEYKRRLENSFLDLARLGLLAGSMGMHVSRLMLCSSYVHERDVSESMSRDARAPRHRLYTVRNMADGRLPDHGSMSEDRRLPIFASRLAALYQLLHHSGEHQNELFTHCIDFLLFNKNRLIAGVKYLTVLIQLFEGDLFEQNNISLSQILNSYAFSGERAQLLPTNLVSTLLQNRLITRCNIDQILNDEGFAKRCDAIETLVNCNLLTGHRLNQIMEMSEQQVVDYGQMLRALAPSISSRMLDIIDAYHQVLLSESFSSLWQTYELISSANKLERFEQMIECCQLDMGNRPEAIREHVERAWRPIMTFFGGVRMGLRPREEYPDAVFGIQPSA